VRCDSLRTRTKVEKIRERGRQTRIFYGNTEIFL